MMQSYLSFREYAKMVYKIWCCHGAEFVFGLPIWVEIRIRLILGQPYFECFDACLSCQLGEEVPDDDASCHRNIQ